MELVSRHKWHTAEDPGHSSAGDATKVRFRFILRDLFWLILMVALGTGWWLDHNRLETKRHRDRFFMLRQFLDQNQIEVINMTEENFESTLKIVPPGVLPDD